LDEKHFVKCWIPLTVVLAVVGFSALKKYIPRKEVLSPLINCWLSTIMSSLSPSYPCWQVPHDAAPL